MNNKQWYAVYTKYKCEKSVEKDLSKDGIHAYTPLIRKLRQWGKNRRIVELPLITCYVFVKIEPSEFLRVLKTRNALKFVQLSEKLRPIPQYEIDILKRVEAEMDIDVSIGSTSYGIGDQVEINKGPLSGLTGNLIELEGKRKVVIELRNMGLSLRISVNRNFIRRVNAA